MPNAVDLTTLTDLKNYINPSLAQTTASDSILAKNITAVSLGIERYCARKIALGSFSEFRNGNGRASMRTLVYPILSVTSVQQGQSATLTSQTTIVPAVGENPNGPKNSVNLTFFLAYLPSNPADATLFVNGLLQTQGVDYVLTGATITFLVYAPASTDVLSAFYAYSQTSEVMQLPQGAQTIQSTNDKWFIYARQNGMFGLFGGCFVYGQQNVLLNYTAGYITPGQLQVMALPQWGASVTTLQNAQIQSGGYYYIAVNSGTTGLSTPTFSQTRNSLTTDNGILWLCQGIIPTLPQNANIVPDDFQQACLQQSALLFKNRTRVGDTGSGVGPDKINYFLKDAHPSTISLLNPHREVFPTDGMGVV